MTWLIQQQYTSSPHNHYTQHRCVNQPSVCQAMATDDAARAPGAAPAKVFTSELACCTPVVGAYEKGCAWLTTKPPAVEVAPAV